MSEQQPHTPTTQTVERTYVTYGRVDGPLHPEERRAEFFRWLTAHDESIRAEERENITAAEQRGAYRAACQAFRHAATAFDYPEATDQWCTWADVATWLRANANKHDPDNRADQMEGDE